MPRCAPSSTSTESTARDRRPGAVYEPVNKFLKPDCGATIFWLRSKAGGQIVFRPLPAPDPAQPGNLLYMHYEDGGFPWIRRYDVIRNLGRAGLSFVVNDPEHPSPEWSSDNEENRNPVWLLIKAVGQAIEVGQGRPDWKYRTQYQRRRVDPDAQWMGLSDSFMVQGIVYSTSPPPKNEIYGLGPNHRMPVIDMDTSAGMTFLGLLRQPMADDRFWYGDVLVYPDGGGFVVCDAVARTDKPNRFDQQISFLPEFQRMPAALAANMPLIASRLKRFEEIVYVPTVEEQVRLICESQVSPTAIIYALESYYKPLIPEATYAAARQTSPAAVPVAGMPAVAGLPPLPTTPMMSPSVGPAVAPGLPPLPSVAGMPAAVPPIQSTPRPAVPAISPPGALSPNIAPPVWQQPGAAVTPAPMMMPTMPSPMHTSLPPLPVQPVAATEPATAPVTEMPVDPIAAATMPAMPAMPAMPPAATSGHQAQPPAFLQGSLAANAAATPPTATTEQSTAEHADATVSPAAQPANVAGQTVYTTPERQAAVERAMARSRERARQPASPTGV